MSGYRLLAAHGCGSAIVEALFRLADLPLEVEELKDWQTRPNHRLLELNPLGQVPVLVLPDGTVMTESAAMALHVGDLAPAAGLVPQPGDPIRPVFLRWLLYLVATVYPTFTITDAPTRWTGADERAAEVLRASMAERRVMTWLELEAAVTPAPWLLGSSFTAVDVFVAAMTHWAPGRAWFEAHCPKLTSVAQGTESLPVVAEVWRRNFA